MVVAQADALERPRRRVGLAVPVVSPAGDGVFVRDGAGVVISGGQTLDSTGRGAGLSVAVLVRDSALPASSVNVTCSLMDLPVLAVTRVYVDPVVSARFESELPSVEIHW